MQLKLRVLTLLSIILGVASLSISTVDADGYVPPIVCVPDIGIIYNDFDEVLARVFIPIDCPASAVGKVEPVEILEQMYVYLQRLSVAPGGTLDDAVFSFVADSYVDVTSISTVYSATHLIKVVSFSIVPSYTTTDYHRVGVIVMGSQGDNTFVDQDEQGWLAMPPPPLEIDDFTIRPTPLPPIDDFTIRPTPPAPIAHLSGR